MEEGVSAGGFFLTSSLRFCYWLFLCRFFPWRFRLGHEGGSRSCGRTASSLPPVFRIECNTWRFSFDGMTQRLFRLIVFVDCGEQQIQHFIRLRDAIEVQRLDRELIGTVVAPDFEVSGYLLFPVEAVPGEAYDGIFSAVFSIGPFGVFKEGIKRFFQCEVRGSWLASPDGLLYCLVLEIEQKAKNYNRKKQDIAQYFQGSPFGAFYCLLFLNRVCGTALGGRKG